MMKKVSLITLALLGMALSASAQYTINIAFGNDPGVANWNVVDRDTGNVPGAVTPLVDANGQATGVTLTMGNDDMNFSSTNTSGTKNAVGVFPAGVLSSSLYGNDKEFSGNIGPTPTFELGGLDPSATYSFEICASRMNVSDTRTADYTATGSNTATGKLNSSNNTTNTLVLADIQPTAGGVITIGMAVSDDNDNGSGFIYLGGMQITSNQDPLPVPSIWDDYVVDPDGNVDTGSWMGWVNINNDPWIWNFDLGCWLYLEYNAADDNGAWVFASK